jgi:hypothetical protein
MEQISGEVRGVTIYDLLYQICQVNLYMSCLFFIFVQSFIKTQFKVIANVPIELINYSFIICFTVTVIHLHWIPWVPVPKCVDPELSIFDWIYIGKCWTSGKCLKTCPMAYLIFSKTYIYIYIIIIFLTLFIPLRSEISCRVI